jgi:hypothetical protein
MNKITEASRGILLVPVVLLSLVWWVGYAIVSAALPSRSKSC